MSDPIHPLATSIHLDTGDKPNENNSLSTISTSIEEIVPEGPEVQNQGVIVDEIGVTRAHRGKVDRWIGIGPTKVGHPPPVKRFVALNESGTQRIGEDHARAKLTDAQVDAIRDEYEAYPLGHELHIGYRILAVRWGVSKRTIRDIVSYSKRNQFKARWKRIT